MGLREHLGGFDLACRLGVDTPTVYDLRVCFEVTPTDGEIANVAGGHLQRNKVLS